MKLASQEGFVPGTELGGKLDNLAAYGYDGIEFSGNGLEKRQDDIIKSTVNQPVEASTICAGYPGGLLGGDSGERKIVVMGIRTLLKVAAELGTATLSMGPILGAPRISDLSPYKTLNNLKLNV